MHADARFAVVSGTTSGIGQAVAEILLDRGWHVLGLARRPAPFAHALYKHVTVDLAEAAHAREVLQRRLATVLAQAGWTRVGLVNNAASAALVGPLERIRASDYERLLTLNLAMPVWLMGQVVAHVATGVPVRVVNLSTGAAVQAFPGLAAYATSKAGLRMAGMVLAAEAGAPSTPHHVPADVAVLSYEPGTVDTPMQDATRAVPAEDFPWVDLFQGFKTNGLLVQAALPAQEIADFLESEPEVRFTERRYGRPSSS